MIENEELDEDFEEFDINDYTDNMPCDTYGMGACSSSCPNYFKCNQ